MLKLVASLEAHRAAAADCSGIRRNKELPPASNQRQNLRRRFHWLDVVKRHSRSARRNSSERSVKKPRCRNGSSAAPKATIAPDPAPRWANLLSRLSGTHLAVNFVDALASARFRRKVFACAPGEFVQALKCSRSPLFLALSFRAVNRPHSILPRFTLQLKRKIQ